MEQIINKYIPGVCNIGPAEIRARRVVGWLGFLAAVALWGLFLLRGVPTIWRLIIFIPAFSLAVGFFQEYMHFCAAFGLGGLFDFGAEVGKTDTISQAEFRRMDRRKEWQIFGYAALIASAVALIAYFV